MRLLRIDPLQGIVLCCLFIIVVWFLLDGWVTWVKTREWIFYLNNRDYFTTALWILPSVIGHMATVWGHYFRSEREFQHGIAKVTTPANMQQKISLWEHHILWGYTVKYWCLVGTIVLLKLSWILSTIPTGMRYFAKYGFLQAFGLIIGFIGGYASLASCSIILFLILRRSMLHSLGFTYSELLPLHRWLGVVVVVWSVLHTIGYCIYYIANGTWEENFNFYDTGRATMNLMGFVAWFALLILAALSIPQVRRRLYTVFMTVHRIITVIFLVATVVHYPYYMLWYYVLPSVILFFIDRFVPKTIQARTLYPEASIALNADADIIRMTLRSPEPMKPYYPGDYILVQVPELGILYHPFTIASYWPEDPQSIVLFIRTYNETKKSWTGAMAKLCGTEDKRIRIKANVDGVFGDRQHGYLKSEVLIVFVAGAAITTFMALIKAIAAQIASSKEPLRMQFYLICTFRTRSELHAYGSFLHQITRDPRFTTWLHVEVYVSRPDKAKTLMGAHAHVIKNDIQVPGQSLTKKQQKRKRFQSLRRTGTMLKRALSGRTVTEGMPPPITVISGLNKESKPVDQSANGKATSSASNGDVATDQSNVSLTDVESHTHSESTDKPTAGNNNENKRQSERCDSSSVSSSTPVSLVCSPVSTKFDESAISEKMRIEEDFRANGTAFTSSSPTCAMTYDSKRLPTFHDAQSNSVSTRLAKLDLHVTAIMVCIPLGFWFILRAIKWEGPEHYCNVRAKMTATQYKICYGFYSVAPVFGHAVLVSIIGYFAVWYARKVLIKSLNASNLKDIETGKHFVKNPNTNEASASASADLPYPKFELEDEDLSVEDGNWDEGDVVYSVGRMNVKVVIDRFMEKGVGLAGKDRGLITVFGGGPEAFVEHVERQILRAKWAVDFHRETWAP